MKFIKRYITSSFLILLGAIFLISLFSSFVAADGFGNLCGSCYNTCYGKTLTNITAALRKGPP